MTNWIPIWLPALMLAFPGETFAQWKAGVARAVITPDKPVWLAGYGSKRVPDGKIHDIWLKEIAKHGVESKMGKFLDETKFKRTESAR